MRYYSCKYANGANYMDYSYLNNDKYNDTVLYTIKNNVSCKYKIPFFVIRMNRCNLIMHRHEYIQIIYISKGRLKHKLNKNCFDVQKGNIFVIPPYVPHQFFNEYNEEFEIIELEFSPEFINENFSLDIDTSTFMDFAYIEPFLVSENQIKPKLNLGGSLQMNVESILEEIIREYEDGEEDFQLIIKALLLKLLVIVGREFKKDIKNTDKYNIFGSHRDALFSAIDFIRLNFCKDIAADDVAKVAMLSQSYFRYFFKLITKQTFKEYLNKMRIAYAIELMNNGDDKSITEISFKVGYNGVSHFNKIFRQQTGLTPSAFRKGIKVE